MAWNRQLPNTGLTWSEQPSAVSNWTLQPSEYTTWGSFNNENIQEITPERMWGFINLEWGEVVYDGFGGTAHTDPLPQTNMWGFVYHYDCLPFTMWNYYMDANTIWTTQS